MVLRSLYREIMLAWYNRNLLVHPYKTHMVVCGVMMASGDLISQAVVERKKVHLMDWERVVRFLFVGTFYVGPSMWTWFKFLERRIPQQNYLGALKRTVLDQCIFAPISYVGFLTIVGFLKRSERNRLPEKVRSEFWPVYSNNLKVWPLVQFVNFYLVPIQHRLFVTKCVGFAWNAFLSWQTNRD